jgi:hypothetical protein
VIEYDRVFKGINKEEVIKKRKVSEKDGIKNKEDVK